MLWRFSYFRVETGEFMRGFAGGRRCRVNPGRGIFLFINGGRIREH